MQQRTRKAIGSLALISYMGAYAIFAATLGAMLLPTLPFWGESIFFAVAGIIWIFPLKPLFGWMNRP